METAETVKFKDQRHPRPQHICRAQSRPIVASQQIKASGNRLRIQLPAASVTRIVGRLK